MQWGILGWGKIAREALVPAMEQVGHTLVAVGSRAPAANHLPERAGVTWCDYEALIHHPEVEAVYIALPNHLHVPWMLKALAAGKHVLCEKPIAFSAAEVDHVAQAAQGAKRLVREAFMVRHHPQWARLRALPLGELRWVQVSFAFDNRDPSNIRNQATLGGGAMWDIGCYAVFAGQWLFGGEPEHCQLWSQRHPDWGVDIHSHGIARWPAALGGGVLQFSVSTQSARNQTVRVVGERGWAELAVPFNTPLETALIHCVDGGGTVQAAVTEHLGPVNQYAEMVRQFGAEVADGVPTDLSESRAITRTLERLIASAA